MRTHKFIVLFMVVCFASVFAAKAPVITLSTDNTHSAVGDTFAVTIHLEDALPFAMWAQLLMFDTAKVQLISQSEGTCSTFIPDSRKLSAINTTGEVRSGGFGFKDNRGGDFSLGVFRFKRLSEGAIVFTTDIKSEKCPFGFILKSLEGNDIVPAKIIPLAIMGPMSVSAGVGNEVETTSLNDVFPNPSNPSMNIAYQVSMKDSKKPVSLKVFDTRGQLVKVLVEDMKASGRYNVTWNAVGVPSGVYMIKYECGRYSAMRKAMLVK